MDEHPTARQRLAARWRALVILAIASLVMACSGSAASVGSTSEQLGKGEAPVPAATAAPAAPADEAARGGSGPAFAGDAAGGTNSSTGYQAAFRTDADIVKTGTLAVEVPELDPALVKARSAIVGLGGYVSGSDEARQTDHPVASVTYRIPADRWDDALDKLRTLGKPLSENTNAVEVTGQLVDLQARITNLRSTESALQAIMAKATKISDILDVQQQLTDIRGQIEELAAQQAHLQDQATYGTLTVTWTVTPPAAVAVTTDRWDGSKVIDQAVASLVDGLQSLATLGIWFAIVGLPFLLAIVLLVAIAVFVLRRLGFGRGVTAMPVPPAPGEPTAA